MSETPRVDEAAERGSDLGAANTWMSGIWDVARTLERELAVVTRERDEARQELGAEHHVTAVWRGRSEQLETQCDALRAEVERLRSALLTLADAADDVGVRHFDGDTLPASVERMQTATATARAALQEPTP